MWSRMLHRCSTAAVRPKTTATSFLFPSTACTSPNSIVPTPTVMQPRVFFSSSADGDDYVYYPSSPLDAFRDTVSREKRATESVGRQWTVKELRRKSYEDLHKLWYVLYKEKNMLLTEANLSRRHQIIFPQPERKRKVQKSMGAIKQVLAERKRVKIKLFREKQLQEKQEQEEEEQEAS